VGRTRAVQKQEDYHISQLHRYRRRLRRDVDYNLCRNKTPSSGWHIGEAQGFSTRMIFFRIIDSKFLEI
jgi:hypothetical protein